MSVHTHAHKAETASDEAGPEFVVVMTLTLPDYAWREAYGPKHGPITPKQVAQYLTDGLFPGGGHAQAVVHEVRALPAK